jgi:hypothetical protein
VYLGYPFYILLRSTVGAFQYESHPM